MLVRNYRKKPVVIQAVEVESDSVDVCVWLDSYAKGLYRIDPADGALYIVTLEGEMRANVGDWIIRGVRGEFYPCKPDIFADTYEEVCE